MCKLLFEKRIRRLDFSIRLLLHFHTDIFFRQFQDWKPILLRIGASVSVRTQGKLDRSLKKIDVIIGNSTPPSTIVKDAREKDMFVVTSKWIVQCLINGEVIPYGDYLI